MAFGGVDATPSRHEEGEQPARKYQIQPGYENGWADEGRDDQNRLAGPNSEARRGTWKYIIFLVANQAGSATISGLSIRRATLLEVMTTRTHNTHTHTFS